MPSRISIIIPTFDRPAKLGRALRSCLSQTAPPYEILVVDNGENPQTLSTVEAAARQAAHYPVRHINSPRFDVRKALKTGIEAASGHWLILLDDDDFLVPDRIAQDQALLSKIDDDVCVLVQDFVRIDYGSGLVWLHRMAHKKLGLDEALMLDSFPPPPAATWRCETIQARHSFDQPDGWMTDFDLYASLLPYGSLHKTGRVGYVMDDTRVAGRLTGNIDKSIAMIELHRERFRRHRAKAQAGAAAIDRRLDQQIAFFAAKAVGPRALFGATAPYTRPYLKETFKGCIAPLRACASRILPDALPEMRGSKSYSLKRFTQDEPSLGQLIRESKL